MKRERLSSRYLCDQDESAPGKASDYIRQYDYLTGTLIVLYCRVSARSQKGELPDQVANLRLAMEAKGAVIVGVYKEIVSGWKRDKRRRLVEAAELAKSKGAILVAVTTDRFLRNFDWTQQNDVSPTVDDYEALCRLTLGVPLATLNPPELPYSEAHGVHVRRGQAAKGNKGGRPRKKAPGYKKARWRSLRRRVHRLWWEGKSERQIAFELEIPKTTASRWVRRVKEI